MKLSRTIVLVGLMGAGKTSVGRRLSELIDAEFYDSDDEIELAAGMPIPEIFERFGEGEFRRGEAAVLSRLLADTPCILSTGGGAFMSEPNRSLIEQHAVSVWLNVELDVLWSRVQDKPGRPLLVTDNPYQTLAALHKARSPCYALADVSISSSNEENQEDVAQMILEAVTAFDIAHPERAVLAGSGANG